MRGLALEPCLLNDPALIASLTAAGQPVSDLAEGDSQFYTLTESGKPLAFGGLEGRNIDRLLRSVVVPETGRGTGIGRLIVRKLADTARSDGAERLWLLTTDAAEFFEHLGWRRAERYAAPEAIRTTPQFTSVCPASATLMVRDA